MSMTVVVGRANSGKTGMIYEALCAAAARGAAPTLVLPTQPDVERASDELSRRVPFGLSVTTTGAWVAELWGLHGDGRRILDDSQRAAVVRRATAAAGLSALSASAETPGFADFAANLVVRCAEHATGPVH